MQNRLVLYLYVHTKFGRDILGTRSPSPTPCHPAQGSNARKIILHNFWLQRSAGIESVEELLESQAVLFKQPTHRLNQTHSFGAPALGQQLERHQWHTEIN